MGLVFSALVAPAVSLLVGEIGLSGTTAVLAEAGLNIIAQATILSAEGNLDWQTFGISMLSSVGGAISNNALGLAQQAAAGVATLESAAGPILQQAEEFKQFGQNLVRAAAIGGAVKRQRTQ